MLHVFFINRVKLAARKLKATDNLGQREYIFRLKLSLQLKHTDCQHLLCMTKTLMRSISDRQIITTSHAIHIRQANNHRMKTRKGK